MEQQLRQIIGDLTTQLYFANARIQELENQLNQSKEKDGNSQRIEPETVG